MDQVSQSSEVNSLFMEPKLTNYDALVESDEVFPNLPELDINDLPPMDVTSQAFRSSCASAYVLNQFLDTYKVSFQDRITLVKGVLEMAHGIASTANSTPKSDSSQGKTEYYGTYL